MSEAEVEQSEPVARQYLELILKCMKLHGLHQKYISESPRLVDFYNTYYEPNGITLETQLRELENALDRTEQLLDLAPKRNLESIVADIADVGSQLDYLRTLPISSIYSLTSEKTQSSIATGDDWLEKYYDHEDRDRRNIDRANDLVILHDALLREHDASSDNDVVDETPRVPN